ncbi:MAG: hypothetical protein WCS77_07685 [Elusimicrobiaceae bacterium]
MIKCFFLIAGILLFSSPVRCQSSQTVAGVAADTETVKASSATVDTAKEDVARAARELNKARYEKMILKAELEPSAEGKVQLYTQALSRWNKGYGSVVKGQLLERRGTAYSKLRKWDSSAADLKTALKLNPKSVAGRKLLSRIYQLQGKCAAASDEIGALLKQVGKGEYADLYYQRALINALCLQDMKKSIADFNSAIRTAYPAKHSGLMLKSFLARGELYCLAGNFEEGNADIAEASQLDKSRKEYLVARGTCRMFEQKFTEADQDFTDYISSTTGEGAVSAPVANVLAEAYCKKGQIALERGEPESAQDLFTEAIGVAQPAPSLDNPTGDNLFNISDCYFYRAGIYEGVGEYLFAEQDYEQACKMGNRPACSRKKRMLKEAEEEEIDKG